MGQFLDSSPQRPPMQAPAAKILPHKPSTKTSLTSGYGAEGQFRHQNLIWSQGALANSGSFKVFEQSFLWCWQVLMAEGRRMICLHSYFFLRQSRSKKDYFFLLSSILPLCCLLWFCVDTAAGSASPLCACSLVFGQWQTCPAWTGFSLLSWPLTQTLHKHGSACFPACMLHCELPVGLSQSLVACKDQNTGMEDDLGVLQAASPSYLHFFFPWVTWFIKVLSPVISHYFPSISH